MLEVNLEILIGMKSYLTASLRRLSDSVLEELGAVALEHS